MIVPPFLLRMRQDLAERLAEKSPDPYKKVGCAGLNSNHQVVAMGFNHIGPFNNTHPVLQDRDLRRPLMIHAEIAMLRDIRCYPPNVKTVVITLFPCIHCMTALAAWGVETIYYGEIYDKDLPALKVADFHGITHIKY